MEGFVYKDWYNEKFQGLTDEELGKIVRAASEYHAVRKEPALESSLQKAFDVIRADMADISCTDNVTVINSRNRPYFNPSFDLTEEDIQNARYLHTEIIPGIESVALTCGLKMTAFVHGAVLDWIQVDRYTPDEITDAIKASAMQGKVTVAYIGAILKNGRKQKAKTTADYRPAESREVCGSTTGAEKSSEQGVSRLSKYVF